MEQAKCRIGTKFKQTDILGAVMLASVLFSERSSSSRHVLIVYSDMQQDTSDLNLESQSSVPSRNVWAKVERLELVANLSGVEVFAMGVEAKKRTPLSREPRGVLGSIFRKDRCSIDSLFAIARRAGRLSTELDCAITSECQKTASGGSSTNTSTAS